jgi:HAMP domain-containing protein
MKLAAKFSIVFVLIFSVGLAGAGAICHRFLLDNARDSVLQQARLMLETTLATREYTSKQVGPLVQLLDRKEIVFHPETVPGFAATEHFSYVHAKNPEYSYKEATLNPTNLRDRASDWEADLIHAFSDDPKKTELIAERDTPTGRSLVLARPMVASAGCMRCHSAPAAAPASMVRLYGNDNGFGWKTGEVIGAQVVSVPLALPIRLADNAFRSLMASLVALGALLLVVLNLYIYFGVVKPVTRLASMADEASKGHLHLPELPVKGRDELAVLAGAFNRMQRSLERAMKMLGE